MAELIRDLGFDPSDNNSVFLFTTIFTFGVVTILWAIGLLQGNHSMMDGWYGFAYAVPAFFAYLITDAGSVTAALLVLMVGLHGGRLGWYLASRWRRYVPIYGGDPRYLGFVEDLSPGYWWKSFFKVMEPQAVIIVLIGAPAVWGVLANRGADGGFGALAALGMAIFAVGFYHETLGDGQLQAFLAQPKEGRARYLNTGVWTHSRHPHYFGNTLVWWGIWLVAMDGNAADVWWTAVGPLINTIMLTSVLGTKFQDDYMGSRPEYRELMARTRGFLPIPLSRKQLEAKQTKLAAARRAESSAEPTTTEEPAGR